VAKAAEKQPEMSQARPGFRRVLLWSVRSGKVFALVTLSVAGWFLYNALTSPRYVVQTVTAQGTTALTANDVESLADVHGRSIWFVRDNEVEQRVRQSPYVEQVRVRVVLPDNVVVQVTERLPEFRWTYKGATYDVLSNGEVGNLANGGGAPITSATDPITTTDGGLSPLTISETTTLSTTQQADGGMQNFVNTVEIVDTTPNRELKPKDRVDPDALEVARRVTLRKAELPAPLQRIEWDGGLGVSLIVGDNKQAVIGKSERLDEKLAILIQLLRDGTPFTYLDLRPTTPYYR
jgi:cell division protein FtsQ